MFKKLKQKIEEGGDVGIDKVSFTPKKLPGSAVRTLSRNEEDDTASQLVERLPATVEQEETRDEDQGVVINDAGNPEISNVDMLSTGLPDHMMSKSTTSYETILEARVKELEQKCNTLSELMTNEKNRHSVEVAALREQMKTLDRDATELKLQVVELQLEKTDLQECLENEAKDIQENLETIELQVQTLKHEKLKLENEIEKKEMAEIGANERYSELEKKVHHLQSRVDAYSSSNNSEVILRLQSEVADLERAIQLRDLDIQMFERRIAVQAIERGDDTGVALEMQQKLEVSCKELTDKYNEVKSNYTHLQSELTRERENRGHKERELTDLQSRLHRQVKSEQRLMEELNQLKLNHDKHMQDVEQQALEKDHRIKELLHNLKQLRGESGVPYEPKPPGLARRTASIGIQTVSPWFQQLGQELGNYESGGAAVLPLSSESGNEVLGQADTNGDDYITMKSLGPEEEMEIMRQQQLRLEEQVTEKNKIIRVQQLKIVDMRKELQRSLSAMDVTDIANKTSQSKFENSPSPPPEVSMTMDVNFQYLKHVIIKFMCSRDDEALQLIRAISTLLQFSPQEEKHVKDYLFYKLSWFGRMPAPLYQPLLKNQRM